MYVASILQSHGLKLKQDRFWKVRLQTPRSFGTGFFGLHSFEVLVVCMCRKSPGDAHLGPFGEPAPIPWWTMALWTMALNLIAMPWTKAEKKLLAIASNLILQEP